MKLLALPVLVASLVLQSPSPHTVLSKRYQELYSILRAKYPDAYAKWITLNTAPDFVYRSPGGEYEAAQLAAGMRQEMSQMKGSPKVTVSLGNVAEHPKTASCSVTVHLIASLKSGKKWVSDATTVDTWELTPKGWRLKAMVLTRERVWVDGKQVVGG